MLLCCATCSPFQPLLVLTYQGRNYLHISIRGRWLLSFSSQLAFAFWGDLRGAHLSNLFSMPLAYEESLVPHESLPVLDFAALEKNDDYRIREAHSEPLDPFPAPHEICREQRPNPWGTRVCCYPTVGCEPLPAPWHLCTCLGHPETPFSQPTWPSEWPKMTFFSVFSHFSAPMGRMPLVLITNTA